MLTVHPGQLAKLRKTIDFDCAPQLVSIAREMSHSDPDLSLCNLMEKIERLYGKNDAATYAALCLQHVSGSLMWVHKEISDMALRGEIAVVPPWELPWPSTSIELFFEDPTLPAVICNLTHVDFDDRNSLGQMGFLLQTVALPVDGAGRYLMMFVGERAWQSLFDGTDPVLELRSPDLGGKDFAETVRSVALLICAVLTYAAVPQVAPVQVRTHKELPKVAGKGRPVPGIAGRPSSPIYRVVYLPKVLHPFVKREASGSIKAPHERNAHKRTFKHPRYKNMRGKTIDIGRMKIHGGWPAGVPKTIYRVRKAPAGSHA